MDTQNDHNDGTIHLKTNDADVGFAVSTKNLPPEDNSSNVIEVNKTVHIIFFKYYKRLKR